MGFFTIGYHIFLSFEQSRIISILSYIAPSSVFRLHYRSQLTAKHDLLGNLLLVKLFLAVGYLWIYWTDFGVCTLKMKLFPSSCDLVTENFSNYFPKIVFSDDYVSPSSSKTAKINGNTRNHQKSWIFTDCAFIFVPVDKKSINCCGRRINHISRTREDLHFTGLNVKIRPADPKISKI